MLPGWFPSAVTAVVICTGTFVKLNLMQWEPVPMSVGLAARCWFTVAALLAIASIFVGRKRLSSSAMKWVYVLVGVIIGYWLG